MSTKRTYLLAAVPALAATAAAGFLVAGPLPAGAAHPSLTCGAVVTTDVRLTADLLDCPGSGLVVGAPGITIDLAGHVVDGTGSGAGIDNEAGHDGVRIRRGTVREFQFGIHLFGVADGRVDRVAVDANMVGVIVHRAEGVGLDRVVATDSLGTGIEVAFSADVTVRRSAAVGNGLFGIVDRFSERSRYERNLAASNDATGLTVDAVSGAVVERNEAIANAGHGLAVEAGGDNTVTRNVATDNTGVGISAPDGAVDGGRNRASGNGEGDCVGVVCR